MAEAGQLDALGAPVSYGQSYVTSLVNAAMNSPEWDSAAILLAWDDWGGLTASASSDNTHRHASPVETAPAAKAADGDGDG